MSDSFRRVFVFVLNGGHIYFRGDTRIKAGSSVIYSVVNILLYMGSLAGHKTQRHLLLLFFFKLQMCQDNSFSHINQTDTTTLAPD